MNEINLINTSSPLVSNIRPNQSTSTITANSLLDTYIQTRNIITTNIAPINYEEWIIKNIPIIYYIKSFKNKKNNKVQIEYGSNINYPSFFPNDGSLLFSDDFYGVYYNKDYYYWTDRVLVEFNSEDKNKLTKDLLFTPANQFDLKVSNEELLNFLKNNDDYKDFIHIKFEEYLNSSNFKSMEEKKRHHKELDKMFND